MVRVSMLVIGLLLAGLLAACGDDSSTATTAAAPVETTTTEASPPSTLDPIEPQVLSYDWEAGEVASFQSEIVYHLVDTSDFDQEEFEALGLSVPIDGEGRDPLTAQAIDELEYVSGLAAQDLRIDAKTWVELATVQDSPTGTRVLEFLIGGATRAEGTRAGRDYLMPRLFSDSDPQVVAWAVDDTGASPGVAAVWPPFLEQLSLDLGLAGVYHSVDRPFGPVLPSKAVATGDTWEATIGLALPWDPGHEVTGTLVGRVVGGDAIDGIDVVVLETSVVIASFATEVYGLDVEVSDINSVSTSWFDPEESIAIRSESSGSFEVVARFTADGPELLRSDYEVLTIHELVQRAPLEEYGHSLSGVELLSLAEACVDGDDVACDVAFTVATAGFFVSQVGSICGGRGSDQWFCSGYDQIATEAETRGDDPFLDALSEYCEAGVDEACHALLVHAPPGSEYSRSAM